MKKEYLSLMIVAIYGIVCAGLIAIGWTCMVNDIDIGVAFTAFAGLVAMVSFNFVENKYEL